MSIRGGQLGSGDLTLVRRYREDDFVITGRSAAAVQRGVEAWHEEMNAINALNARRQGVISGRRAPPVKFETCGLKGAMFEVPVRRGPPVLWTVEEILTMKELRNEGAAMKHCVSSYWFRIEDGVTSIWTVQRDNSRQLTVEVNNAMRSVVQVKGACNKPATSIQNRYLLQWVNENNLRVRSR